MEDCVFCKIARGEKESYKVYEDDDVVAFLDAHPLSEGHTLVLPKKHYENVYDIPDDLLCKVHNVAKKIALRIRDRFNPKGIIILQNTGEKAGQSVFHYHVHVKPVYDDTVVLCDSPHRSGQTDEEMKRTWEILK
jgi:histidine triad (HIT) family protein